MSKSYKRKWLHRGSIIRQRGHAYQVEINAHGKRYRKTLSTHTEAETYIDQKLVELTNQGTAAFALNENQKREAVEAFKDLGNIPLTTAVKFYLRHHRPTGGTRTVKELLADYLEAKAQAGRRPDTLTDLRCRISNLAKRFGDRPIHTLTTCKRRSKSVAGSWM